jgi:uncharacterized protein YfiM (DUF2279 family)
MRGFLLMFSLQLHNDHPRGDSWFAADKARHFFTATFIQSASYGGLRFLGVGRTGSLAGATAITAGLSVGKELRDRRGAGTASAKDLVWDAAGIIAASALLNGTQP